VYYTLAQPAETCLYLDLAGGEDQRARTETRQAVLDLQALDGPKDGLPVWDVWPIEQGECAPRPAAPPSPASIATGIPDTELEQQLQASLLKSNARNRRMNAPAVPPAAPLSNGNGAPRPYAAAAIPAPPPVKIPYDVAFRELLQVVIDGLKAAGEQWSDSANRMPSRRC